MKGLVREAMEAARQLLESYYSQVMEEGLRYGLRWQIHPTQLTAWMTASVCTGLSPATLRMWEQRHGFPVAWLSAGEGRADHPTLSALSERLLDNPDGGVVVPLAMLEVPPDTQVGVFQIGLAKLAWLPVQ